MIFFRSPYALFAVFLLILGMEVGDLSAQAAESDGIRRYIHHNKLFSMHLPTGLTRGHPERYRGEAPTLVLRSEEGYVLSVETRQLAMSGGAGAVLDRLERLYMGKGRAWRTRKASKPFVLGGLPAIRATYTGPETSGLVAVSRGKNTDFLIMFMTPTSLQDRLAPQFDWILERFDVARSERRDEGSPLVRAPVFKAPGLFHHDKLGYTLRYPETWTAAYMPPFSAEFTPRTPDEQGSGARIRIQNVSRHATDTPTGTALLEQWKRDLSAAADAVTFTAPKPLAVQTPSGPHLGQTAFAGYSLNGRAYRQWMAVLPRDDGMTVHLWRFDAPLDVFDLYLADADAMLRSLVMEAGGG